MSQVLAQHRALRLRYAWRWFQRPHQFKGSCWGQEARQIEPESN
jgi:hypothetical protein